MSNSFLDVFLDVGHNFIAAILGVFSADFSRNGKTRRNGHAQQVHLGKVGAFTAEQISHTRIAFGFSIAERIDFL